MDKYITKIIKEMNANILGVNIFNCTSELPLGENLNNFFLEENINKINTKELAGFSTKSLIKTVVKTNQYIYISKNLENEIFKEYYYYYNEVLDAIDPKNITRLSINHQRNLIKILSSINELKSMDNGKNMFDLIPCSEYSPEQQIQILEIDFLGLEEPILDIGCGMSFNLVKFLRDRGYNAYGIDRIIEKPSNYTKECSWLDFNYGINEWGSIISHLGFTNHFKREHLKKNSNYIEYAQVYMKILHSLKKGGSFYYTPNLDFIEPLLNKSDYKIQSKIIHGGIGMSRIIKL